MEELPGNSHKARRAVENQDEKKLEKVVTGEVSLRKKPLGKRFTETLFGGDGRGVFQYILLDVLVPAAKDTIADVITGGIERALFGETRSSSRRTGARSQSPSGFVSYNRYSTGPLADRQRPREAAPRGRNNPDFDEIILATRIEAETVLDQMDDLLRRYETVSIGELYEMLGLDASYTYEKWGWTDLSDAKIVRVRNGYLLELPRAESIAR